MSRNVPKSVQICFELVLRCFSRKFLIRMPGSEKIRFCYFDWIYCFFVRLRWAIILNLVYRFTAGYSARERTDLLEFFHWSAIFIKSKSLGVDGAHFIILTSDKQHVQLDSYFWLILLAFYCNLRLLEGLWFNQDSVAAPRVRFFEFILLNSKDFGVDESIFLNSKIACGLIKNKSFIFEFIFLNSKCWLGVELNFLVYFCTWEEKKLFWVHFTEIKRLCTRAKEFLFGLIYWIQNADWLQYGFYMTISILINFCIWEEKIVWHPGYWTQKTVY